MHSLIHPVVHQLKCRDGPRQCFKTVVHRQLSSMASITLAVRSYLRLLCSDTSKAIVRQVTSPFVYSFVSRCLACRFRWTTVLCSDDVRWRSIVQTFIRYPFVFVVAIAFLFVVDLTVAKIRNSVRLGIRDLRGPS